MPEIKNAFIKGKMNKDLDERLVPNGEYRDALNIDVDYSEGSDAGALKNVLGNIAVGPIPGSGDDIISTGYCIGNVKDTKENKIYWLIQDNFFTHPINGTYQNRDIIAEYDIETNTLSPVLIDFEANALNFNRSYLVTGINILDGILYFTDGLNEPKQIDVEYWKTQTSNFYTDTTGLTEERITVIKKSPLQAPTLDMDSSTRGGNGTQGNTNVYVNLNLSDGGGQITALDNSLDSGDDIVGTFTLAPNYKPGDIIILTHTFTDSSSNEETKLEARILLKSAYVAQATFFDSELLTISETVPGGIVQWQAILEEDEPLFELKFPLFSYRYKYTNGQYSCFAPFSKAAFLPDSNKIGENFEYDSKNGYNVGMTNTLRQLELQNLNHNISTDVEEVDVLYKDSLSSNVYIVDTIKKINGTLASTFEIKDEQIFKTIEANQLLRLFDSVPKKAKSQEISANRIIYGNYTHQFNLPNENPLFNVKLKNRYNPTDTNYTEDKKQMLSIKSNRTYQLGVVYIDKYGRQTPVLTDKSGIIKVPFNQAKNKTQFQVSVTNGGASGFENYKYFIKEISSTTYNLCADSFYQDDEGAIYISFPSSEINKVKEEDILLLKKKAGNNLSEDGGKFKVLDKLSTVPDFLAKPLRPDYVPEYFNFGRQFNRDSGYEEQPTVAERDSGYMGTNNAGRGGRAWFLEPGSTPVPNHNSIIIRDMFNVGDVQIADASSQYTAEFNGISSEARSAMKPGSKIRWNVGGAQTKVYTVKSFQIGTGPTSTSHDDAEVTFEEEFGEDVLVLYDEQDYEDNPRIAVLAQGITIETLNTKDESGKAEYAGKFFIKLQAQTNLLNELVDTTNTDQLVARSTIKFDGYDDGDFVFAENRNYRQFFIRYGGKAGTDTSQSSSLSRPASQGGWANVIDVSLPVNWEADGYHFCLETELPLNDNNSNYGSHPFIKNLKEDNYIRFSGFKYSGTTRWFDEKYYKIKKVLKRDNLSSYSKDDGARLYFIKLDQPLDYDLTFHDQSSQQSTIGRGWTYATLFDFDKNKSINIINPPIFEVEPQDDVDIDIYYETQEVFPMSGLSTARDLEYHNCYSFGNGVESFVIRDDYNAPVLGKGVRVSTVFEDNYQEENLKSGLIYSQVYNGKTGINRLNQFIIADKITKDLNPEYGSIQKLHGRDTDLLALCEDKIVKILANKDAVFNADGNPQLIASNRVLGQAIIPATFGSYGCQNPESFVEFTYRSYFVDKVRGCVLRLSADGITEVSNYGMKDYFKDNLRTQVLNSNYGRIFGTYDEVKNQYNISLPTGVATTVSYSESINGWVSRKSFLPEGGLSINNKYYTFKNGSLYEHHSESGVRNTFYGVKTNPEVTFLFNEAPANVKNFRTLNYEGSPDWTCASIITDKQDGSVPSFVEKEGKYYNYISGVTENENTIDTKALNVQGLGNLTSQTTDSGNRIFTFNFNLNNDLQIGDNLYYVDSSSNKQDLGKITAINKTNKTITIVDGSEVPQASAYMFYSKDAKFNTSGILGYYAETKMTNTSTDFKELYSVGAEVSISS